MKPRMPIRRFDVFAEYHRARHQEHGMPEALAKGRGLWAAKVVAGRGRGSVPAESGAGSQPAARTEEDEGFRRVGGIPQTDQLFDREIIGRMGPEFYHQVFRPAIEQAVRQGKRYEDIRDSIREEWK